MVETTDCFKVLLGSLLFETPSIHNTAVTMYFRKDESVSVVFQLRLCFDMDS